MPYGPSSSDRERISENKEEEAQRTQLKQMSDRIRAKDVRFSPALGHPESVCVCVCTRDVRVFLSVEGQFIFCGQVDKGFHGGEIGNVSVADLTEQRLQVPT